MKKPQQKNTLRTERESLIREVTNDLLKSKFTTEVGQKAKVERRVIEQSAHMDELREVVADVGRNLEEIGAVPKGMTYRGSLSVHVYTGEATRTFAAATISNHGTMTFDLADAGLRELTGTTLESYGRSRKKLRSGF